MIIKVAVLGAGTMGAQIAGHMANAGLTALLLDVTAEQADRAVRNLEKTSPPALFLPQKAAQIETGSFEKDLSRISGADWVIEAVVEDFEIKKRLLESVDSARKPGSLVTTNTSGLSVAALARDRSPDFRRHWFGTHFFNPPRYMKLLEIIPTAETDPGTLSEFEQFAEIILGKGVVRAKDTPNFIANRIGLFATFKAIGLMLEYGLTVEEVDYLTGPVIGHARSATFRTIDIVGLDVFSNVANNIREHAPDDPQRNIFEIPEFMRSMLGMKLLGTKTRAGFYKKAGDEILTIDLDTMEYRPQRQPNFSALETISKIQSLPERLKALFNSRDRAAGFVRDLWTSIMEYAASRAPEISDDPDAVDRAMQWGFSWETGPLALSRALKGDSVPAVAFIKKWRPIHENPGASLRDLGDGVACLEFHSKMNTVGGDILSLLFGSLEEVNSNFEGLVIGNQGRNFSAGADLMWLMTEAAKGNWDEIDRLSQTFQRATQAIRHNPKPVVVAPFGLTLGGGCEIAMAGARIQAAAETYIGLVETGAGLIPGGGGTAEMLFRTGNDSQRLREIFENISLAKVSTSAEHARQLRYLRPEDGITMNSDRLIHDAKAEVLQLAARGYRPPVPRQLPIFGESMAAQLKLGVYLKRQAGHITDYDEHIAQKLVYVLCGGDVTRPATAPEQYFLDLERETFKSLCGEPRTLARIEHLLKKGKALRN